MSATRMAGRCAFLTSIDRGFLGLDFLGLIGSSERAYRDEMTLGLGVGLDSLRDLCAAKGMSTPEQGDAQKTEREWREMRKRTMGELLQRRAQIAVAGNQDTKFMIDMELERRKFVRDVMIDRWLAGGAILVSLASLVVSVIALSR
jgi:hypothetical protein